MKPVMHYRAFKADALLWPASITQCGLIENTPRTRNATTIKEDVTCKNCLKALEARVNQ